MLSNYRFLSDADPRNTFDVVSYLATTLQVKQDEEYEHFEYNPEDFQFPEGAEDDFEEDLEPV